MFKGIVALTIAALKSRLEDAELEAEWSRMLKRQLPALPLFGEF